MKGLIKELLEIEFEHPSDDSENFITDWLEAEHKYREAQNKIYDKYKVPKFLNTSKSESYNRVLILPLII